MDHIFIGIGSNRDNPRKRCIKAIKMLACQRGLVVKRISSLYKTAPLGYTSQEWFVNGAVEIETDYPPGELLTLLKRLEILLGRKKNIRWGPREIDLDILFYHTLLREEEGLRIPHPLLSQRRFVLVPLADIAGDFLHPVTGETVKMMLERLALETAQRVEYLGEVWFGER